MEGNIARCINAFMLSSGAMSMRSFREYPGLIPGFGRSVGKAGGLGKSQIVIPLAGIAIVHLADQLFAGFGCGMNAKEQEGNQQGEQSAPSLQGVESGFRANGCPTPPGSCEFPQNPPRLVLCRIPRVVSPFRVALELAGIEVHLAQVTARIPLGLVVEVSRARIAALASGAHRARPDPVLPNSTTATKVLPLEP